MLCRLDRTSDRGEWIMDPVGQRPPSPGARLHAARKGDKGFTLVEVMIVIVILGVLAGIVAFSVRFITDRGDHAACRTNLKDVQSAVEAYYSRFGEYPP